MNHKKGTQRIAMNGESKTTRIMMAVYSYVTSGSGLRKKTPVNFCASDCTILSGLTAGNM
jgi:hypothetical protein